MSDVYTRAQQQRRAAIDSAVSAFARDSCLSRSHTLEDVFRVADYIVSGRLAGNGILVMPDSMVSEMTPEQIKALSDDWSKPVKVT